MASLICVTCVSFAVRLQLAHVDLRRLSQRSCWTAKRAILRDRQAHRFASVADAGRHFQQQFSRHGISLEFEDSSRSHHVRGKVQMVGEDTAHSRFDL